MLDLANTDHALLVTEPLQRWLTLLASLHPPVVVTDEHMQDKVDEILGWRMTERRERIRFAAVGRAREIRHLHVGNHPEVGVGIRCAYSLKTWAWEIEDRSRTGLAVRARNGFRQIRRRVMQQGIHQRKWIGSPLRWLGPEAPLDPVT